MLDAYIIEEIKKQEDERRRREEAARPRLRIEIPAYDNRDEAPEQRQEDDDTDGDVSRGIIRIELRYEL